MADLATAFVRIRPNLTGFQSEAEAGTKTAGLALGKIFAVAFGAASVAELGKAVIDAASTQQAALARVTQITAAAGAAQTAYGKSVKENLIDLAEKSGFSVEDLAQGYGRLEQQTKNTTATFSALGTATDVARARGQSLATVATAITRAYAGNAQGLSRLGIILPAYTAQQDAVKQKITELSQAEQALSEIRKGETPINLDAQAAQYEKLGDAQRTQLKDQLTQSLAAAAASDKLLGAQQALAEVSTRFSGQSAIFGDTAAGEVARFHVAITELEVSIGQQLLPYLAQAAEAGQKWAAELQQSGSAASTAKSLVSAFASAVTGVVGVVEAAAPEIEAVAKAFKLFTDTGLAGPLVIAGLVKWLGLYNVAVNLTTKSLGGLAISEGVATTSTTANAEAAAAATKVYRGFGGQIVTTTGELEAESAAAGEAAASTGLLAAAFSPAGIVVGIGATAAGLYLLNQYLDEGTDKLSDLRKGYAQLAQTAPNTAASAAAVKNLADQYTQLGTALKTADAVGGAKAGFGDAATFAKTASDATADWISKVDSLANSISSTDPVLKNQITNIEYLAVETGKIPSTKQIQVILNDTQAVGQLSQLQDVLKNPIQATIKAQIAPLTGTDLAAAGFGKGPAAPEKLLPASVFDKLIAGSLAAIKDPLGKQITETVANATTAGVAQSGPSIATQVAAAFKAAVLTAKQSLTSIGSTIGDSIGTLLDAQLTAAENKLAKSPAAQQVKALNAEATRLQAQVSARDATNQIATTMATLQQLQQEFGTGALTADQQQQLTAAQNAVLDAQDNAQAAADTKQASHLQTGLDAQKAALEKRETAEKTAAAQRVADLDAELNKGLISEKTYAAQLSKVLSDEGVNFKTAGKLLGSAFSDGFQEQIAAAIKQAKALANLTPAQRGAGTGGAPIVTDPRKVAATTRTSLETKADAAALTKNTSDTVTELKKLGAVIQKTGTSIHITIPPDVSKKDTASIVKLAKSLK